MENGLWLDVCSQKQQLNYREDNERLSSTSCIFFVFLDFSLWILKIDLSLFFPNNQGSSFW